MEGKHYDKIVEDDWIDNSYKDTLTYANNIASIKNLYQNCTSGDSDSITISTTDNTTTGSWWEWATPTYQEPIVSIPSVWLPNKNNNKKGDDDMRYLFEVILVNPKNNEFTVDYNIAKTETSALMTVYNDSDFEDIVKFDDLKTSCRVLMEYKEEKSLKKAIETIKKAVE